MKILTINCGSSSLKLSVQSVDAAGPTKLASGAVERIGDEATVVVSAPPAPNVRLTARVGDHAQALERLLERSELSLCRAVDAVGHRVVFGGSFSLPSMVDPQVEDAIESGERVAPLHNGPSLVGLRAARKHFPDVPMVAVFDTAFHSTIPAPARTYTLPHELELKYDLRRHGYHGIAHRSLLERYAELTGRRTDDVSLITLQLGSGCSATAISNGRSVDTSMGFTPLEGLIMGTRTGDIDAGMLVYLQREAKLSADQLERLLNERSGLLGLSGASADMGVLLDREKQGDPAAHMAVEAFCYRVRKYVGAYLAVLGRTDAIIFGGGIGERSPEVRRRVCEPLTGLGITIDSDKNERIIDDGPFTTDNSPIAAWVVRGDEERIIARDTFELLSR